MRDYIRLWSTFVPEDTGASIMEVISSGWLNTGEKELLLRQELSKKFNFPHCVATNNGTAALRTTFAALGVGPGDEVVSTPYTFIATNTSILEQGATPVFADIDYDTFNIDPESIDSKITKKTKAIVGVHYGGTPFDLDAVREIGRSHNLPVVEDAAHSWGSKYKGNYIGSTGHVVCFSLQAIKILTTADGGIISTSNEELYENLQQYVWYGVDREQRDPSSIDPMPDQIDKLGFKYNMNDVAAAMGLAGLRHVDEALGRRKEIGEEYRRELSNCSRVTLVQYPDNVVPNYQIFPIHVADRPQFARHMEGLGIQVRVNNRRNDRYSIFGGLRDLPSTKRADDDAILIPIHADLTESEVQRIVDGVNQYDKL
jgi:perosamine synthetase